MKRINIYITTLLAIASACTNYAHAQETSGEAQMPMITDVVIPAAGMGTRFLPWTKAVPKELVPIMGKPALQYIIEEATRSGVHNFVLITNEQKDAIKKHFTIDPLLNNTLQKSNKLHLVEELNKLCSQITMEYINQENALGLGHAVSLANGHVNSDYFAVMLPDDIMDGNIPALQQLISIAQKYDASVIAVQEVPMEKVSSYGVIQYSRQLEDNLYQIEGLVEKPSINQAPSNLAIIGRYILSTDIFSSLATIEPGAGGEYQLTDAIADMIKQGKRVLAYKIDSRRFDTGNPTGWLEAVNHFAQK